jgi:zinc resistance-associated protein
VITNSYNEQEKFGTGFALREGQKDFTRREKMKKILTVAGVMVLVAALAVPAMAQGPGMGRGRYADAGRDYCPRYGGANLTEEQRGQLDQLHQKFFDDTAQLRSQLLAKQSELRVLMNTSNPDFEKAKALQKEVSDLKGKMAQERLSLSKEERKINPDARFGRGWGHGPKGRGMGYERGMGFDRGMGYGHMGGGWHRGGYGPGSCWN